MSVRHPLQDIKSFPSLVKYLRDELEWPIETDSFDDLTFEFTADELGLKAQDAAKVRDIKQLRPLASNQPWGIFFISFEPKRLPVVALRRILGSLVVRKRASANRAERAAWDLHDLLFISQYGEGDDRQITLAHFSEGLGGQSTPTLKVLGWDELDTQLNLEHIDRQLHERLRWPDDDGDLDIWRVQWSAAFTLGHRHAIRTARELAEQLADLARRIRRKAQQVLDMETERGPLRKLYRAFQEALIHDLGEDDFADMYAQTITYGLFSAAVSRTVEDDSMGSRTHLSADNVVEMVPITNPFLRDMLSTFLAVGGRKQQLDFDELGIQDVVEVLGSEQTDLPAVLRNFGDLRQGEDPVIHFYEDFLKQYDKKRKVERGVFYTPQPVVSYIVRSVHQLLRSEFGLEDGLASTVTWGEMIEQHEGLSIPNGATARDPFVVILDPATGTATFLVEVIDVIRSTMVEKWKSQGFGAAKIEAAWNEYVPKHLLPRLYGYELMMAPYAIAHMKIGLKLSESPQYKFASNERARIYLTNALEPPSDLAATAAANLFEALGHEAQAVNAVKQNQRFTVVIGNPPYAGISSNMSDHAQRLIDAYKFIDGQALKERKHWLQDDYVKFLRLSQTTLDATSTGILGFITNHGFLDNPTFRGMRQSLLGSFTTIHEYDLHGSTKKANLVPDGVDDQNVFDIQQGVAITLGIRADNHEGRRLFHGDLWGDRQHKYRLLQNAAVTSMQWREVIPVSPYYFFVPKNLSHLDEYQACFAMTEAMPEYVNGIVTARDGFVIDFEDAPIGQRITVFLDSTNSDTKVKESLGLSENYAWRVRDARRELRASSDWPNLLTNILYRPFDLRRIIYHRSVVWRTRSEVMRHMMAGRNLGLCTNRQVNGEFRHVGVTRDIINDCTLSLATKERTYLFPLWLYPDQGTVDLLGRKSPQPNLSAPFLKALATKLGLRQTDNVGLPDGLTPEDIFHYAYAVFHSPGFRSRYAEFLKIDFPRLPLTGNLDLFRALARLGGELTALHLLESPEVETLITEFIGGRHPEVEKVSWAHDTVWVNKSQNTGFRGVREEVWNFHIGGYQVCHKWLKDRKGRTLSDEDIAHYQKIVVALSETIRLMAEIDEVIEEHGGWPGAFVTNSAADTDAVGQPNGPVLAAGSAPSPAHAESFGGQQVLFDTEDRPLFQTRDESVGEPMKAKAATATSTVENEEDATQQSGGNGSPATRPIDDIDRNEVLATIREVFSSGGPRDRNQAIREVAVALGYQRVGPRIAEVLATDLLTAVRRGVLSSERGEYSLLCRTIDQFTLDHLVDMLTAAMGSAWQSRDDAVTAAARHIGFRRTGPRIADQFKSAINAAIRRGLIERDGASMIRRTR